MSRGIVLMLTALTWSGVATAQPAIDPTDRPLWHVAVHSRGVPAVAGERVFAVTSDHEVLALARDDGRELWRRHTRERGAMTEGTTVVVGGDTVIAGDWDVYAYDAASGEPRWAFHPTVGYGPGHFLGPVVGTRVYMGSPAGQLYALDVATGRQLWRAEVEPVTDDGPLTSVYTPVSDGTLVVAGFTLFATPDRGGAIAVDAETGRERWRFSFPAPAGAPRSNYWGGGPVLTADLALVVAGDGRVWALDLATGTVRWVLPPLEGPIDGIITTTDQELRGLAVVDDLLIVGSLTGYLTAYDLATRRQRWQLREGWLGSLSWHGYQSADGVVYVPFVSGFLFAVEAASGRVLWRTNDYRQGLMWPARPSGDRVIAAGASGVWALPSPRATVVR